VTPFDKKKPKRSAKPKREQPENQLDATIQGHPAPEAAETRAEPTPAPPQPANGAPTKPTYDWDRTQAEAAAQQRQLEISKTPFPVPNAKTLPFDKFCEYWNALYSLPVSKYARLYIRRWWPVMLPEEIEDVNTGLRRESHPSEKTITAEFGPFNEQRLLDEVGVGDYTMRLNDNRRGWEQGTVLHCEMYRTHRNFDNAAPLLDVKRLDWDDASNGRYIKWGQAKGILPRPDQLLRKDTDEMASVTAITDRALDEASKERARADQIQQEQLTRARAEAETAKSRIAQAEAEAAEAKRQADELKTKVQPGTPAAELLSVVTSVAHLANSIKPAPDNSFKDYLALEAERERTRREREKEERDTARETAKLERERADKLQAEVIAIRTAPPPVAVPPAAPPTLAQQFQEMEAVMGTAKRIAKGGSNTEEEEKPSKIDKWLEAAPIVAPIVGSFVNGIFQTILTGLQVWERNHYNDAVSRKGEVHLKTPPSAEKVEPGNPIPPQAPTQTAEQIAQQQQWAQIMAGVQMLAPHLVRFLDKGKSGAELAEFVIENADEQRSSYERIRHLADSLLLIGVQMPGANDFEKFTGACRFVFEKIPALWAKVGSLPTMPKFLADFYNYDQIREEEEQRLQEEQR
jgi:hypothetical protein